MRKARAGGRVEIKAKQREWLIAYSLILARMLDAVSHPESRRGHTS